MRYSSRAFREYEEILEYLLENFGSEVAARIDAYFEKVIDGISINPFLFPLSEKRKDIRRCIISPQTTLYYRFDGKNVELVSFRGNRMNPEKIDL